MSRITRAIGAGMLVIGVVTGSIAMAQQPSRPIPLPPGIADAFQPAYLRRDILLMDEALDLDEGQRAVFLSLFDDYDASFRGAADEARDRIAEIRPFVEDPESMRRQSMAQIRAESKRLLGELEAARERGLSQEEQRLIRERARNRLTVLRQQLVSISTEPVVGVDAQAQLQVIMQLLDEWEQTRAALRDKLIEDVAALLNDEQLQRWDEVAMSVRRQRLLRLGRLSGESIDNVALARDLELGTDEAATLAPILQEYERAIDEALRRRDDAIGSTEREIYIAALGADVEQAGQAAARQVELRIAVRDVNEAFRQRLIEVLPEGQAALYDDAFLAGAFPRVYRATEAGRVLAAAAALSDLDETRVSSIEAIRGEYEAGLRKLNWAITEALRDHEPVVLQERAVMRASRMARMRHETADDPSRPLFRQRSELGDTTLSRLTDVLTEEQLAVLPWEGWRTSEPAERQISAEILRKFDSNGNGVLDPSERVDLPRYLRSLEERE